MINVKLHIIDCTILDAQLTELTILIKKSSMLKITKSLVSLFQKK